MWKAKCKRKLNRTQKTLPLVVGRPSWQLWRLRNPKTISLRIYLVSWWRILVILPTKAMHRQLWPPIRRLLLSGLILRISDISGWTRTSLHRKWEELLCLRRKVHKISINILKRQSGPILNYILQNLWFWEKATVRKSFFLSIGKLWTAV